MSAKKVTLSNLGEFSAFLIKSEDLVRAMKGAKRAPETRPSQPSPFGSVGFKYIRKRKPGKRSVKPSSGGSIIVKPTPPRVTTLPPVGSGTGGGVSPNAARLLLWEKRNLSASAAQIVPAGTQIKGHVTLGQARFRLPSGALIDPTIYFRNTVFSSLSWAMGTPQVAVAKIRVFILGVDQGVHPIKLTHDAGRISGQGNVPTWLHWGSDLITYLKAHNTVGRTLRLFAPAPTDGADFFLEIV